LEGSKLAEYNTTARGMAATTIIESEFCFFCCVCDILESNNNHGCVLDYSSCDCLADRLLVVISFSFLSLCGWLHMHVPKKVVPSNGNNQHEYSRLPCFGVQPSWLISCMDAAQQP
jgi:hypothetical protein